MDRTRTAVALCCLAALLAVLTACGGPAPGGLARMLDRHAAAVMGRDERAFLADVAPALRDEQRRVFRNLADVPFASWSYRLVTRTGDTARVELAYRVRGYDTAAVTVPSTLTLTGDGRIAAQRDDTAQLWDQGPVGVVRGAHSLVLGVGADQAALRGYAADADRAVPSVAKAWGSGWARQVVLEVPASLDRMAELLNASASAYRDIAAVTTAELRGSAPVPADRIVVNPDAFAELSALGRQVVLTHETTHVATRAATTSATPLWLSEGYADWSAYRTTGRTPRQVAPELAGDIAAGRVPARLPADADFGTTANGLAQAYEGGWLACRLVAERWGADRLAALYRAAGTSGADTALRRTLGLGLTEFTARWRAYVQRELG